MARCTPRPGLGLGVLGWGWHVGITVLVSTAAGAIGDMATDGAAFNNIVRTKHWTFYGSNYFCAEKFGYWKEYFNLPEPRGPLYPARESVPWEAHRREDVLGTSKAAQQMHVSLDDPAAQQMHVSLDDPFGIPIEKSEVMCTPSIINIGTPRTGSHALTRVLHAHPQYVVFPHETSMWAKANISSVGWKGYLSSLLRGFEDADGGKKFTRRHVMLGMRPNEHATNYLSHVNDPESHELASIPKAMLRVFPKVRVTSGYRCAVERSWSHFFTFYDQNALGGTTGSEKFHLRVVREVGLLNACFGNHDIHSVEWARCAYGSATNMSAKPCNASERVINGKVVRRKENPGGVRDWPSNGYTMLRKSLYSVYWQIWLEHFPLDQFYVAHTEHMLESSHSADLLNFCTLAPRNHSNVCNTGRKENVNQKSECSSGRFNIGKSSSREQNLLHNMWPETRNILEEFFEPFEKRGCELYPKSCKWFEACRAKKFEGISTTTEIPTLTTLLPD